MTYITIVLMPGSQLKRQFDFCHRLLTFLPEFFEIFGAEERGGPQKTFAESSRNPLLSKRPHRSLCCASDVLY
jgi:hypothetical protein